MKRSRTMAIAAWVVWVAVLTAPAVGQDADEVKIEKTETCVLDVRDLILPIRDFSPPTFELQEMRSVGGGTGGGGGVFDDEEGEPAEREEYLNDLIEVIRQVVAPGTWDEGSGNAIRGRGGSIIMTHRPVVLEQVKKMLDEVRLRSRTRMVSVHVRFVQPKAEDLQRIVDRRLVMARTDAQKVELLKLAGETVAEVRTLGMDGQQTGTGASTQSNFIQDITQVMSVSEEKGAKPVVGLDPDIGTVQGGAIVRTRAVVVEGKVVVLDFRGELAQTSMTTLKEKIIAAGGRPPDARMPFADWPIQLPVVRLLVFQSTYRIPDGALLLTGGGTALQGEPKGVYALIRVDVIDPEKAPEKK